MKKEESYFEKHIEEMKFVAKAMGVNPKKMERLIRKVAKSVNRKG